MNTEPAKTCCLSAADLQNDTITVGTVLYFVYHGMADRPVSRLELMGDGPTTYHRRFLSDPSEAIEHSWYAETPIGPADRDMVLRAWDFEQDLSGFGEGNYPPNIASMDYKELASAQLAYVDMVRAKYALRMAKLSTGYWGIKPGPVVDVAPDADEDDRL